MGKIAVHEFITLDGVIETPTWTVDFPFDPKMGEAIAAIMGSSKGSCWDARPTRSSRRPGPPGRPTTTRAPRS